jgi:hypothetical protein
VKILKICISILLTIIILSSCDKSENAPTETVPPDQIASAYYPGGLNSTFAYRQDTLVTVQSVFDSVGNRNSVFSNYAVTGGSENITQDNILDINGSIINSKLNFRRTDAGVYFLIDTLDIISVLSTIPDSLIEQIEINIDNEINVFSTPFYTGKNYSAFKATIGSSNLPIDFTLVEVKVNFEGDEEIFVEALSKNMLSQKMKYEIILKIPNSITTNILDFLSAPPTIYNAFAWFVKDVGLVKLEGNSFLINALNSGSFDLADTTGSAREVLTDFNLQ